MTQHLFAAEADQIQDLIFRASRLHEVMGGSQLLMRFGEVVEKKLLHRFDPKPEVVTAKGGSFRILFNGEKSKKQALEFGQKLAELYRLTTGGTISVAEPTPVNGSYEAASEKAQRALRLAKRSGHGGRVPPHLPYMAFCASCGTALASSFCRRTTNETREQYFCRDCLAKGAEPGSVKRPGSFLRGFFEKMVPEPHLVESFNWPGTDEAVDPTESLANVDPRNYVAYMVADGNNMGILFSKCNKDEATGLSTSLEETMRQSLAQPARLLRQHQAGSGNPLPSNPILPLILGGDDLFALLPAPWAIDAAYRFCQAYEESMKPWADKFEGVSLPTIAAAVVICKVNYPYYLAHQAGEERLQQAKETAKQLALKTGIHSSVVNFEIITGSQLVQADKAEDDVIHTSLRPYWVHNDVPPEWGAPVSELLDQREKLKVLPHRRRAQLRTYFNGLRGEKKQEAQKRHPRLEKILSRIDRTKEHRKLTEKALQTLGGPQSEQWLRAIKGPGGKSWPAHGLPDLLDAWDYCYKIDVSHRQYQIEED